MGGNCGSSIPFSLVLGTVTMNQLGGWVITEAGENPARPRHCERSERIRNVHSKKPLGRDPREGESGGLEPGDLTHPKHTLMSPRGGTGMSGLNRLNRPFPSLGQKGIS
jgi:hypothetical protein